MSCYTVGNPSLYIPPYRFTSMWYVYDLITNESITDILIAQNIANKLKVLQYFNGGQLTKQQKYSQMAKGTWTNRNTTWATQNLNGYTNPINLKMRRSRTSYNIAISRTTGTVIGPTTLPVTCPFIPTNDNNVLPTNDNDNNNNNDTNIDAPPVIPPPDDTVIISNPNQPYFPVSPVSPITPVAPIVIPNNGSLLCHTFHDFCN